MFKLYWYDLYPYLKSNTYIKNDSWAAMLHKKAKSLRKGTALSKAKRCAKGLTIYYLFIPSHSTKRKPISYLLLFISYYLISRNPIPIAHAPNPTYCFHIQSSYGNNSLKILFLIILISISLSISIFKVITGYNQRFLPGFLF